MVGYSNLLTLSQAAIMGVGAYLSVLFMTTLGISLPIAVIAVFLSSALIGLIVHIPAIRLKSDFFVLATIGFQYIIYSVFYNFTPLTNGPYGISDLRLPIIFSKHPVTNALFLGAAMAAVVYLIVWILVRSPFIRVIRAIKEDETPIITLGRNPNLFKLLICMISSGIIGVGGLFYALYIGYIEPGSFVLDVSIFILLATIIGGTGTIWGSALGAVFIVIIPELLAAVGLPSVQAANIRQIVFGILLIVLMRYQPQGLYGVRE
jgi:branched-chain amino acid transport system permease protein